MHKLMPELNYPINAQIEVTEDCNQRCFYCYNSGRTDFSDSKRMTLEEAQRLSEILVTDVKPFNIVVTGGEPLMNMPATIEFAKLCAQSSMHCSINSNLALLDKDKLQQLKAVNTNLGFLVSIPSINEDVFEAITGRRNLKKVLSNLELLFLEQIDPTVNMVVHKKNKDQVYEEGLFLHKQYGLRTFAATPALNPAFGEPCEFVLDKESMIDVFRDLNRLKENGLSVAVLESTPFCMLPEDLRHLDFLRRGCSAGRTGIQITYNGDVRSCSRSPFVEGNLFSEKFRVIWEKLKSYRENKYAPKECDDCAELDYCHGSCRYEGLDIGERPNKPDSRMIGKLKTSVHCDKETKIDPDKVYVFVPYKQRQEDKSNVTIYANKKYLTLDDRTFSFVEGIKKQGFHLDSFPNDLKAKATYIGKRLISRGFLK